jgi:hypothetical protein
MNLATATAASRCTVIRTACITGMMMLALLCLGGCASWHVPDTVDDTTLRTRAVSLTVMNVTLSASVLSSDDSLQLFGTDLNSTGVQPVWIEVTNNSTHTLWLLRAGTDPNYFSPLEVAWPLHTKFDRKGNAEIDRYFESISFESPIPPGVTRSGILFTNPHRGTHVLNVDFLGQQTFFPFTLFLPIPGEYDSKLEQGMERLLASDHAIYQDSDSFRKALEQLPCCTTGGEPVNLVLVGEIADIATALIRRGYRAQHRDSDDRQQLFGRPPDISVRKSGEGVAANWIRIWVAPLRYQGKSVLMAQSGRPVGGRFALATSNESQLHPDVDESRNLLIQDLLYSGGLAKLGFVRGVGPVAEESIENINSGYRYYTDGLRAVLFFVTRPLALSDIEILDWVPLLQQQVNDSAATHTDSKQGE